MHALNVLGAKHDTWIMETEMAFINSTFYLPHIVIANNNLIKKLSSTQWLIFAIFCCKQRSRF